MKRTLLRVEMLTERACPALFGNPWLDPNLTLSFVPEGTLVNGQASRIDAALANLPAPSRTQEMLRAFQSWIAVANVNVGIVPDGGQAHGVAGSAFNDSRFGDIRVAAVPLNSTDIALAFPFDVAAGTRAGDVLLNSSQPFRIGTGGYDLFSVLLHEAGHVFGVEGSTDPTSAMFQFADRVRTGPNANDVAAIQALYGPRRSDAFEGTAGNATSATAARLQPREDRIAIVADLTTASDVDVYSFKAEKLQGGAFLAQLHVNGLSLVVPRLEILNKDGTVLATGVGSQPGSGDVSLRLTNLKEGDTYFARITSTDATFAVGAYRLELRAENVKEDDEDLDDPEIGEDDSPSTADSLERLQAATGTRENFFAASSLSSATDVDFYRVRSSKPAGSAAGALTLALTTTDTPTMDAIVEVFNEFQQLQPATVLSHDGGEYVVQVATTKGNQDYFLRVRHAPGDTVPTGNYSLGIDFGGPAATTKTYLAGDLTSTASAITQTLVVPTSQVLHLILNVGSTASPTAVRMTIFDSTNKVVDTRLANAGTTSSMNVFLPAGTYQLLAGGGATSGAFGSTISFSIQGGTITDPIGPKAVPADQGTPVPIVPPPPPPIVVTPPQPVTPTVPVTPNDPNILLIPPTDQPTSPTLRLRPVTPPPAKTLSVGTANFSGSVVQSFQANGSRRFQLAPFANYTGAIRTTEADVNGDGIAEILVGTGPGSTSQVRLYDGGSQSLLFSLSPFEASFTGGVFVALGDMTGDGRADLIVTPDEGGGPRVRIFNGNGFGLVMDYFGIEDPNFRGGARAAVGDLNADGTGDVIVAAGFAGGPRVAAYDGAALSRGTITHLFGDFFAFEQTLRNGVYITAGDIDGDGFAELIAGAGPGGGPRVLALSGKDLLTNQFITKANFFAGDPNDRNGVRLAVKNLDTDGRADLVVNVGQQVRGYAGVNLFPTGTPPSVLDLTIAGAEPNSIFVG